MFKLKLDPVTLATLLSEPEVEVELKKQSLAKVLQRHESYIQGKLRQLAEDEAARALADLAKTRTELVTTIKHEAEAHAGLVRSTVNGKEVVALTTEAALVIDARVRNIFRAQVEMTAQMVLKQNMKNLPELIASEVRACVHRMVMSEISANEELKTAIRNRVLALTAKVVGEATSETFKEPT